MRKLLYTDDKKTRDTYNAHSNDAFAGLVFVAYVLFIVGLCLACAYGVSWII